MKHVTDCIALKGRTHHEQPALALLCNEALHVPLIHDLQCSAEDLVVQEMQAARQAYDDGGGRGSGEVSLGTASFEGVAGAVSHDGRRQAIRERAMMSEPWPENPPSELLVRHCE